MDSLERLENVFKDVPLGSRFFDPNDVEIVIKELRAAREAVIACRTGNRADSPVYDDFEYIAERMKEAEHG